MATVINLADFKACRLLREMEQRVKATEAARPMPQQIPIKPSDTWEIPS